MKKCMTSAVLCIFIILMSLLYTFGAELDPVEIRWFRKEIAKAEIYYSCNPFFEEYRKSLDEMIKIISFDINFEDVPNLKKNILQYRTHIVTLLDKCKNEQGGKKTSRDEVLQSCTRIYEKALKKFDDDHFVFKAEFVQCLINGDNLSSEAEEYVRPLYFGLFEEIRELPDEEMYLEKRAKLRTQRIFYELLLTGMSMEQYYKYELGE